MGGKGTHKQELFQQYWTSQCQRSRRQRQGSKCRYWQS